MLLEPLSLRERTEEGDDLDAEELYERGCRPHFAMNRLFLITTSRIGAAICIWSLTEGALLYRLEHSFDSAVSGAFVMDELPDGCLPTGLALSKDGNLALLAVAGGYLFSWDFSALNPRPRHSGMVPYSDEDQPRLCSDLVRATCKPKTQTTWGPYMTRDDPDAEGHRTGRLGPPLLSYPAGCVPPLLSYLETEPRSNPNSRSTSVLGVEPNDERESEGEGEAGEEEGEGL